MQAPGMVNVWNVDLWQLTEAHGVIDGFGVTTEGPRIRLSDGRAYVYGQHCPGGWELDLAGRSGWQVIEALPGAVRCGAMFGDAEGALPIAAVWCDGSVIACVRDLRRRLLFATFAGGLGHAACGEMQIPDGLLIRRVQAAVWKQDGDGTGYWETAIATVRIQGGWADVTFDKDASMSALIVEGYERGG